MKVGETLFTDGKGISGQDYGIQVYPCKLTECIKIITTAMKYSKFPIRSHLGTNFNFPNIYDFKMCIIERNGKALFVFERKLWRSRLKLGGTEKQYFFNENVEASFTIEEKEALVKLFEICGIKVLEKWNHEHEHKTISIQTDIKLPHVENYHEVDTRTYNKNLKKFLEVCNDLGGITR